jgi:hypothetical protein
MANNTKSIKLKVIWEIAPDPDPYALIRALAILFDRRIPLSTEADLTKHDDTLKCECISDH